MNGGTIDPAILKGFIDSTGLSEELAMASIQYFAGMVKLSTIMALSIISDVAADGSELTPELRDHILTNASAFYLAVAINQKIWDPVVVLPLFKKAEEASFMQRFKNLSRLFPRESKISN